MSQQENTKEIPDVKMPFTVCCEKPAQTTMTASDLAIAAEHGGCQYASQLAQGYHFSPNS